MLSSRVSIPSPPNPTQEDIFSSSLSNLFTDDTQNSHGIPGQAVTYHSPRYGEIRLAIPQHPDIEEGRKLFAHYLWNAGIVAADAIEHASHDGETEATHPEDKQMTWDTRYWDMREKNILELGAGTALPSLISALSGASSITITDHPSSPALTNDTISRNVRDNLKTPLISSRTTITPAIAGLSWGDPFFTSPSQYGKLADPQPAPQSFDKIIIADCLWMPSQHLNLVKTIDQWLHNTKPNTNDISSSQLPNPSTPCALIIAGFHTGRSTVSSFFDIATGAQSTTDMKEHETAPNNDTDTNASLSIAQIFEVDVDLNIRDWLTERPGETKDQTKRWCVCAVLVRRDMG